MRAAITGAPGIDTSRAHPARVYDCWLGGKDNYAADREVAQAMQQLLPETGQSCQDNRGFLARAVEYLAREHGIRQFLDIGTGLPTSPSVHEVAQKVAPESRVVYVDNDPIVLTHARALLAGSAEGATAYIDADLRDPAEILAQAARTLDFQHPVAVLVVAIFHFVADAEDPYGIAARLMEQMPQGSALVLSHMTGDGADDTVAAQVTTVWADGGVTLHMRDRTEAARFFDGLELAAPEVVPVHEWRPEALTHRPRWWLWGGVGLKTGAGSGRRHRWIAASRSSSRVVDRCRAEGRETALMLQKVDRAAVRAADAAARAQGVSPPVRDVTDQRDSADVCHAALVVLAEALTARGFNVVCSGEVLCARNLAADPPDGDPQAWALTPGLSQSVMCRPDGFGRPWLWWVWSSVRTADSDGGDGLESLCEATEIEYAAERIAHVIAVPAGGDA